MLRSWRINALLIGFCLCWKCVQLKVNDWDIHQMLILFTCHHAGSRGFHHHKFVEIQLGKLDWQDIYLRFNVAWDYEEGCHDWVWQGGHRLPEWKVLAGLASVTQLLRSRMSWSGRLWDRKHYTEGLYCAALGIEKVWNNFKRWCSVRMLEPRMCALFGEGSYGASIRHVGLHVQARLPQSLCLWLGGPYSAIRCSLQEPHVGNPYMAPHDDSH